MKNIKIKFNNLTIYLLLIALLCGYIKYALYVLLIVLFHELGHVFIITILGYNVKSVEIFPFGGMTKIDKPLNSPIVHDFLIAIFGIVFQLFLMVIGYVLKVDPFFLKINKVIIIFNLLPIIPLDGSKILLEVFCLFVSFKKAIKAYFISSFIFIIIYLFLNYHHFLNNYLIVGLFIYKTIEVVKNKSLIYHKFLLERCLYNNLVFDKVKNKNENINEYQKDVRYFYYLDSKIISDKEYLINYFFDGT